MSKSELRVAVAGDTMLGRRVGDALASSPPETLFSPEVVAIAREADLFVLNLECCISTRGQRWPDPDKPFFFRAPPQAVDVLLHLGVDCVTLANNHALDYGSVALVDTIGLLIDAGISVVGAGEDVDQARQPVDLDHEGFRLRVVGLSDHPRDFAADLDRPGVAYANLENGVPGWVLDDVAQSDADAILVSPHWGPNMAASPLARIRQAAEELVAAGATVVAGHSAHVFQGVAGPVLYDLGDFIDDYAVDPELRNDLGLLFLIDLGQDGPTRIEAIPLFLDYCHTRLARGEEVAWIHRRFARACAEFGSSVELDGERMVVSGTESATRL